MIHRVTILAAFGMLATSTHSRTRSKAADGQLNLTGSFRSRGRDGTHDAEMKGSSSMWAASSKPMQLRWLIREGVFARESSCCSQRTRPYGKANPITTARLRNISLPLRPERVADH